MTENKRTKKVWLKTIASWVLPIAIFIVLDLLAFFFVFNGEGEILFRDFTFPINSESFSEYHYPLWNGKISRPNYESIYRLPSRIPFVLLVENGVEISTVLTLLLYSTVLLAQISFYIFARVKLKAPQYVSIPISFFFGINIRSLDFLWETALVWGYALLPLLTFLGINIFKEKKYRQIIITAILLIITSSHPFSILIAFLTLGILMLMHLSRKNVLAFITIGILYALLGSYFIFPILGASTFSKITPESLGHYVVTSGTVDYLSSSNYFNIFLGIRDVINFVDYKPGNFILQLFWIVASLFPFVLVLFYLFKNYAYRSKNILTFALISWIVLLALSGGTNGPISSFYEFLFSSIPASYSWIVRSPLKWQLYSFFPLFIMITFALMKWGKLVPLYIIAAVVTVLPTFQGYFLGHYLPVSVPDEYYEINALLTSEEHKNESKVLYLPRYNETETTWSDGRSIQPFDIISTSKPTVSYWFNYPRVTKYLYNYYYAGKHIEDTCSIFRPYNIDYIVFHNDRTGGARNIDQAFLDKLLENDQFETLFDNNSWYLFGLNCNHNVSADSRLPSMLSGKDFRQNSILSDSFKLTYATENHKSSLIPAKFDAVDSDLVNDLVVRNAEDEDKKIYWLGNKAMQRDETKEWAYTIPSSLTDFSFNPKLSKYSLENWSNEYFKGAIFTSTPKVLIQTPEEIKLQAPFFNTIDVDKFASLSDLIAETNPGEFSIGITETGGFYEIASSDYLKVSGNDFLLLDSQFSLENAENFHLKVKMFDDDKKPLSSDLILARGMNGNVVRRIQEIFTVAKDAAYIKIIYAGTHSTSATTRLNVRKTQLSELRRFLELNVYSEDVKFPLETGRYQVLARVFENDEGGQLKVKLGDTDPFVYKTENANDRFVWADLGTVTISSTDFKISVENQKGLNAISGIALISYDKYLETKSDVMTQFAGTPNFTTLNLPAGESKQHYHFSMAVSSEYIVWGRSTNGYSSKDATVKLNGTDLDVEEVTSEQWVKLGVFKLEKGQQKVEARTYNGELNLLIASTYLNPNNKYTTSFVELTKINSYRYQANLLNYHRGAEVILPETYDPLWIATDGQKVIFSEIYNSNSNLFKFGESEELTIIYLPQILFFAGTAISVITLTILLITYPFLSMRARHNKAAHNYKVKMRYAKHVE